MDARSEIAEFLRTRRARITPEQAGVASFGPRRVPGLRREEVAVLAGVSVPYYTRLERGDVSGASEGVLEALAHALRLDDAEREHLFDLARAARPATPARRRRAPKPRVWPSIQHALDAITGAPALVHDRRLNALAGNALGHALYAPQFAAGAANSARFVFFDPASRALYDDWERAADDVVAILRSSAGRDPHDRELSDLVGELSTRSDAFRTRWAAHDVRFHDHGIKLFHHPIVGELRLTYDRLDVFAAPGVTMMLYSAEPGSRSAESLGLLASWIASAPQAAPGPRVDAG